MAETLRSDGKAVDIVLTQTVTKGDPILEDGWRGIAMQSGSSGETIAIEVAAREHEIQVGGGITAAKGDILYMDASGDITNDSSDAPFMKVTLAKDANNYVWGILIPQSE